jgi:hypothetical protein
MYATTLGSTRYITLDPEQGFGAAVGVLALLTNGGSSRVERLAAGAVSNTTAASDVPVFGTLFFSSTSRKLVTVNMTSGVVTQIAQNNLAFNPQCTMD